MEYLDSALDHGCRVWASSVLYVLLPASLALRLSSVKDSAELGWGMGLNATEDSLCLRAGKESVRHFSPPLPAYMLPPVSGLSPASFSYVKSPAAVRSWSPKTPQFRSPVRGGNGVLSFGFLGWTMRNCTAPGLFSQSVSTRCTLGSVTPPPPEGEATSC